jgi:hypothetical protein
MDFLHDFCTENCDHSLDLACIEDAVRNSDEWHALEKGLLECETTAPESVPTSKSEEHSDLRMSSAAVIGVRRAKLVAKLIGELNVLRPQMQVPEDDYPKFAKENPNYETFKICAKNPSASKWVKLLPDRRKVQGLAWELAAVECQCSAATIKTAWKKYKERDVPQLKH